VGGLLSRVALCQDCSDLKTHRESLLKLDYCAFDEGDHIEKDKTGSPQIIAEETTGWRKYLVNPACQVEIANLIQEYIASKNMELKPRQKAFLEFHRVQAFAFANKNGDAVRALKSLLGNLKNDKEKSNAMGPDWALFAQSVLDFLNRNSSDKKSFGAAREDLKRNRASLKDMPLNCDAFLDVMACPGKSSIMSKEKCGKPSSNWYIAADQLYKCFDSPNATLVDLTAPKSPPIECLRTESP